MKRSHLIIFLLLIGFGLVLVLAALVSALSPRPSPGLLPASQPATSQPSYRIRWKGADSGYESETLVYPGGARRDAPASQPSEHTP
ncbi:MAG: hypothetical protein V2A58_18790 [Planctomycetota bacterium]